MTDHDDFPWHDAARWRPGQDAERPPQPDPETYLTGDNLWLYRGMVEWQERGFEGAINDRTARILANQYHGGQRSAFYAFVSTGALSPDFERELVANTREIPGCHSEMTLLDGYWQEHGERGPVEAWHENTRWGGEPTAPIPHANARVVAAYHAWPALTALNAFIETGAIDVAACRADVWRAIGATDSDADHALLRWLADDYFAVVGDREAVEDWDELSRDRHDRPCGE